MVVAVVGIVTDDGLKQLDGLRARTKSDDGFFPKTIVTVEEGRRK